MVRSTRRRRTASASRRSAHRRIPKNAATKAQLGIWFRKMHEQLGWMTLAKAKGLTSKIAEYKRSLIHLIDSIDHVMDEYTDMNRIHDLKVLHMEAKALWDYVKKHL